MEIIIGPVTTGGKTLMTFSIVKNLMSVARTTYTKPATRTPPHAYGSISVLGCPFCSGATAAYPPRKANDEPRNAGTLPFVIMWNSSVPRPAIKSVVEMFKPVSSGTNTVAPNMAKVCCSPSRMVLGQPSVLASVMPLEY